MGSNLDKAWHESLFALGSYGLPFPGQLLGLQKALVFFYFGLFLLTDKKKSSQHPYFSKPPCALLHCSSLISGTPVSANLLHAANPPTATQGSGSCRREELGGRGG